MQAVLTIIGCLAMTVLIFGPALGPFVAIGLFIYVVAQAKK